MQQSAVAADVVVLKPPSFGTGHVNVVLLDLGLQPSGSSHDQHSQLTIPRRALSSTRGEEP